MSTGWTEGAKLKRTRSYAPRREINEVKAELAILEAAQTARNLVKEPPNGKEKYRGNGNHDWEAVSESGFTTRLRVPGGWLYWVGDHGLVFVPLPTVLGYAV